MRPGRGLRLFAAGAIALTGLSLAPSPRYIRPAAQAQAAPTPREAYEARRSGVWLRFAGEVVRLLKDDRKGDRHQRFIIRLPDGQTLLVSHNIDLAGRVPAEVGDPVDGFGRYEWNPKGGVVHWTHRDPGKRIAGGWIRLGGRIYR